MQIGVSFTGPESCDSDASIAYREGNTSLDNIPQITSRVAQLMETRVLSTLRLKCYGSNAIRRMLKFKCYSSDAEVQMLSSDDIDRML